MKSGILTSLFILFLLFQPLLLAEKEVDRFFISPGVFNGPELIYNCQKGHFSCISTPSRNDCDETRQYFEDKNRTTYGCLSLKKFSSKGKCQKEMIRLTNGAHFPHWCLRPEFFPLFKQY
ncbi:hypothetical protein N9N67_09690 [Bacteriovoracaceae bacterium]|nr:hypothetical protein [Bacteriovoracaceae bacterium]